MQDKFAADVGDFGKYGLLRVLSQGIAECDANQLSGLGDGERAQRLGVIWYYVSARETLPLSGPAFKYILDPSQLELRLIQCDRGLFGLLRALVLQRNRSVPAVEQVGTLPPDTLYYREPVPALRKDSEARADWFSRGVAHVQNADLVFLDPDNGLSPVDGPEHATYDEAERLWAQGKSLVIYQHADRSAPFNAQIQKHAATLRKALGIAGLPVTALRFHRRSSRVYFIISQPKDTQLLNNRIDTFLKSCWGTGKRPHFSRVDC